MCKRKFENRNWDSEFSAKAQVSTRSISFLGLPVRLFVICLVLLPFCLGGCKSDQQSPPDDAVKKLYQGNKPIRPLAEYTKDNPREWKNIAHEHIPKVRKSTHHGEPAILIEVPLAKANMSHYIEKIGIIDENNKDIAVVTILRQNNPKTYAYFPISQLPRGKKLKAFAKCNLHDLWTAPIDPKLLDYF